MNDSIYSYYSCLLGINNKTHLEQVETQVLKKLVLFNGSVNAHGKALRLTFWAQNYFFVLIMIQTKLHLFKCLLYSHMNLLYEPSASLVCCKSSL